MVAAAILLLSIPAFAQSVPFELAPADPPRFEAAGHLGWEGVSKPGFERWNDRYDSGFAGASLGYFWTSHLKSEVTVSRSGRGSIFTSEPIEVRDRVPLYRSFDHAFEASTVSPALAYQFLENQWVHPFVTGGAHVVFERHEIHSFESGVRRTDTALTTVPFVGAGAKFFVSERAFIRTDIRTTVAEGDTRRISWTAGVGVEF